MKYIDTITPELRETKRIRCLEYNLKNREKIRQNQKWTYYNSQVGKDIVKECIDIYGEQAKTHLREYVRLHPIPKNENILIYRGIGEKLIFEEYVKLHPKN